MTTACTGTALTGSIFVVDSRESEAADGVVCSRHELCEIVCPG